MIDFLSDTYLWIKTLHIIFVIFWCAGLLMLPRFLAYHSQTEPGSEADKTWVERETRLLKIIMLPGMLFTWIFGVALVFALGLSHEPWLMVKFTIVLLLTAFHMMCARWRTNFFNGIRTRSEKFYRIINEVPSVAIILIVIMVVVKPFG